MTAVDAENNLRWFQDVGCLRDLPFLYEVTTADDVYNAYNYLSLCDNSLFTCMGVAGSEVGKGVAITEEIITGMQWGSRFLHFIVLGTFIVLVPMYVVLLLTLGWFCRRRVTRSGRFAITSWAWDVYDDAADNLSSIGNLSGMIIDN